MVEVRSLGLPGVVEIKPLKHGDPRGFFSETYNRAALAEHGIDLTFVQDNHTYSAAAHTVRGIHYQLAPRAQTKLVRVARGRILDVVVDLRRGAATFAKWIALELSGDAWNQILVPEGFGHALVTLEPDTEVLYKVTDYYSPKHDRSIRFDDPEIGIEWPGESSGFKLSEKDRQAPLLAEAEVFELS